MTEFGSIGAPPVRICILGFGNAGRLIYAPLVAATAGLALTSVSSSRGDKVLAALPGVRVYGEAEAMLACPDIDLIIVASPPDSHAAWAKAALAAGKHVLIEKPFTLDVRGQARSGHPCALRKSDRPQN